MLKRLFSWSLLLILSAAKISAQEASLPIGVFDSGTGGLTKDITNTLKALYNYNRNGKYIYRPFMQPEIKIIDPALNVAVELSEYLKSEDLSNSKGGKAETQFYITVPNRDNKKVQLDSAGRFTYAYKYGRKAGANQEYIKTVPFSQTNISQETYERFKTIIPSTYQLITSYQRSVAIQQAIPIIDSIYRTYAEKSHSPGMVYGIVTEGKLLHSGNIGYSNVEKNYLANNQSAFRIASMTKSFVGLAILLLRDKGKLMLDDPAHQYIPELKDLKYLTADAAPITIRNLLTHAAGFPEDNPWGDRQLDVSESEMLAMFRKGISFSNNPGTAYEYSNMGFAMLGYIIKKVSGQPYQDFIAENIFHPLGMTHTYWEYSKIPEKNLALGYRYINNKWVAQPMLHDGAYGAMGGLITTLEDFEKYVSFHLASSQPKNEKESGPVKRSSVREMQKPWQFGALNANAVYPGGRACATVSGYGYGIRWLKDCEGKVSIGHSGGLPGFGSNWMVLPDYRIGIICFGNITYMPATTINTHILDTLIKIADLRPVGIPVSAILDQRKNEIVKLLPDWKDAASDKIFAENFFLDYFIDSLKKQSQEIFDKAGKIIRIREIVPDNNLRGTFIMEGHKASVRVSFTLTPENPARIQEFEIGNVIKE